MQVYDTAAHQRIFTIKRAASGAHMRHAKPHLYWEADSLLYVGWGATVTVSGHKHSLADPSSYCRGALVTMFVMKQAVCSAHPASGCAQD
jgi:hypothetical protein